MIGLQLESLHSKVARRIFVAFLLCALIPFAGLVIIAYSQVASFFNEKSQRQLHEMAKAFGMDIHVRLSLLEAELQVIASRVNASGALAGTEALQSFARDTQERLRSVSLTPSDQRLYRFLGAAEKLPEPTASEKQHLASGKTLVSIVPSTSGKLPRVLMSMIVDLKDAKQNLLVGVVNENFLWGIEETDNLPSYVKPCVLTESGVPLMCADEPATPVLDVIKQKLTGSSTGDLEWSDEGTNYLVSYWTIPMKFSFHAPGWTVVLRTSREDVFASIEELARTFFLAILAAVGFSVLLAIHQLRKRLTPVEKLQESTRRIADKDFDFRVNIRTDDEFEELARSLNSMAGQLGRQFNTLQTTGEIGRAALSLLDTSKVVEIILQRMMDTLRCDCATLALLKPELGASEKLLILWNENTMTFEADATANIETMMTAQANLHGVPATPAVREMGSRNGLEPISSWVASAKAPWAVSDVVSDSRSRNSDFLRENGLRAFLAAPLMAKEDVIGVLSFYSKDPRVFSAEETGFVSGLTSQAAIAIYNSQLYERTRRQAVELEKSNKVKDEFLAIMSHELRTPVSVILGYLNVVREEMLGELNPEQAKALGTVAKHAGELLALVEAILDATMIEARAVVVETDAVNLPSFVEELKSQYQNPTDNDIVLKWECPTDMPVMKTDKAKLKRILQNLLGNAIKFTKQGQVTFSARYLAERRSMEFKVADTGIGIPTASLKRIFEVFHQVDSSKTRQFEGVGLGLYIAKELTEVIGGEIAVESELGCGSTFTVTFPMRYDESRRASPSGLRGQAVDPIVKPGYAAGGTSA